MISSVLNETPSILREGANGINRIPIVDTLLQSGEIFMTGPVDAASADSLIKQLISLSKNKPVGEITLYINSPGGDVQSGLAVYDVLKLIDIPIRTVCLGLAASMGAILFLAGDQRIMLPHSRIMIHDPSPGGGSMTGMKPAEIEESLTDIKKVQKILCDIIAETTGKSDKEVRTKTRKDSFFNCEEALEFGLATEVVTNLLENRKDLSK